ncbi:MAG: mannose-6-phosphate isomerase, class I [Saprospiraceae bacterium]|nr:mannose-6-phosphate isomerase, class I [Saprospiraceae bacterium]
MAIVNLEGKIQHYDWGGKTFIPSIFGLQSNETPCAEYWMGTHPNGMSMIENTGKSLEQYIAEHPEKSLGQATAKDFNNKLPFLFKVLDVASMLSIQVHPTKEAAIKGFAAENKAGIPLNATNRNFKDDNHKPEIMVALSEFWLLHGFRSPFQIAKILKSKTAFHPLMAQFKERDTRKLYQYIMEMPQDKVNALLQPLFETLQKQQPIDKSNPDYWAWKAFEQYTRAGQYDRGIFSIYLLNLVKIEKGGAIFQGAGIPHAYLEGQNMELMANSDNVFRGGLTPKYIDVAMLINHTSFETVRPKILKGRKSKFENSYKTACKDFEIASIELKNKAKMYLKK